MIPSFFGKSSILERLHDVYDDDYDVHNVDYVLDDIFKSLEKGEILFNEKKESIGGLRSSTSGVVCDRDRIQTRNPLGTLSCPGNQGRFI